MRPHTPTSMLPQPQSCPDIPIDRTADPNLVIDRGPNGSGGWTMCRPEPVSDLRFGVPNYHRTPDWLLGDD